MPVADKRREAASAARRDFLNDLYVLDLTPPPPPARHQLVVMHNDTEIKLVIDLHVQTTLTAIAFLHFI
jgi:hypothetical protein